MSRITIKHPVITFPVMGQRAPSKHHVENTEALLEAYRIKLRYNLMRHGLEMEICLGLRPRVSVRRTRLCSVSRAWFSGMG